MIVYFLHNAWLCIIHMHTHAELCILRSELGLCSGSLYTTRGWSITRPVESSTNTTDWTYSPRYKQFWCRPLLITQGGQSKHSTATMDFCTFRKQVSSDSYTYIAYKISIHTDVINLFCTFFLSPSTLSFSLSPTPLPSIGLAEFISSIWLYSILTCFKFPTALEGYLWPSSILFQINDIVQGIFMTIILLKMGCLLYLYLIPLGYSDLFAIEIFDVETRIQGFHVIVVLWFSRVYGCWTLHECGMMVVPLYHTKGTTHIP